MSWATKYLGIPHVPLARHGDALDCWGLLACVYRNELGIDLPLFEGVHPCETERAEIDALLTEGAARSPWQEVQAIQEFDALLFRRGRHATHVGIAIDASRMLHSFDGGAVIVVRTSAPWCHRFVGAYRHEATS